MFYVSNLIYPNSLGKQKNKLKCYFKLTFLFLANKISKINGVTQFEDLSTNSTNGSPEIGLLKAVRKAQNIAQINTSFIGLINILIATAISSIPIQGIIIKANFSENPKAVIKGIQDDFIKKAFIP